MREGKLFLIQVQERNVEAIREKEKWEICRVNRDLYFKIRTSHLFQNSTFYRYSAGLTM